MPEGNPIVTFAMAIFGLELGLILAKLLALGFLYFLWRQKDNPLVVPAMYVTAALYIRFALIPWAVILYG